MLFNESSSGKHTGRRLIAAVPFEVYYATTVFYLLFVHHFCCRLGYSFTDKPAALLYIASL
ncbi:MAG: hypothetical protein IKF06_04680, partial [Lachnospiraceae bacterium]|nr:hypothetical protein [Lachnospiraceae bacterium]